MKTLMLDANVILRFLLNDHVSMSPAATRLFEEAERGKIELFLDPLVMAECCYVLQGPVYRFPRRQIADVLTRLVLLDGVESDDPVRIVEALNLYGDRNVDFTDAYIAVSARQRGFQVASFDRDFRGLDVTVHVPT
ncbi:MAG: PIN domain-containing protein [Alicyclobacillaceae bacterium]|nr:PIN domain-containing protein [Alicyclobacillaceae bacterium]